MIYLDNAATTQVRQEVVDEMLPYFTEHFGNPESVHAAGLAPLEAIRKAEKQVHEFIHSNGKGKIVFTSGGTESNNMVFNLCGPRRLFAMNIITSATEHKSVLEPAKSHAGTVVRLILPGRKGFVSIDDLSPNDIPAFSLISLMHMNNETGMINDVYRIGEMLKEFYDMDVFYHVDCVQSAGELPIYVDDMNVDMVSISSHKIHGPKGTGCLWLSDRILNRIEEGNSLALIRGGGQQSGLRAGTMDVPSIVGFGKACELAANVEDTQRKIGLLTNTFMDRLKKLCSDQKIKMKLNFARSQSHDDKILSIRFPGADAETVVMVASRNGLCISNGAACNSFSSEPSYVLTSSKIRPDDARNTVRVSFSVMNTQDEMENAATILTEAVKEVLSLNLTDAVI